jgi:hypothetical protein
MQPAPTEGETGRRGQREAPSIEDALKSRSRNRATAFRSAEEIRATGNTSS